MVEILGLVYLMGVPVAYVKYRRWLRRNHIVIDSETLIEIVQFTLFSWITVGGVYEAEHRLKNLK